MLCAANGRTSLTEIGPDPVLTSYLIAASGHVIILSWRVGVRIENNQCINFTHEAKQLSYQAYDQSLGLPLPHLPSRFMPTSRHLRRRQARHWFRCDLSMRQFPAFGFPPTVERFLHTYWRLRRIERFVIQKRGRTETGLCEYIR